MKNISVFSNPSQSREVRVREETDEWAEGLAKASPEHLPATKTPATPLEGNKAFCKLRVFQIFVFKNTEQVLIELSTYGS